MVFLPRLPIFHKLPPRACPSQNLQVSMSYDLGHRASNSTTNRDATVFYRATAGAMVKVQPSDKCPKALSPPKCYGDFRVLGFRGLGFRGVATQRVPGGGKAWLVSKPKTPKATKDLHPRHADGVLSSPGCICRGFRSLVGAPGFILECLQWLRR